MKAWKFFIETFGCKTNQYESQAIREAWSALGGEECDAPAPADVICINSCAITASGERDARNAVFRHRRNAPCAKIILTGCSARLFENFQPRPGASWARPDLIVVQQDKEHLLAGPFSLYDGERRHAHTKKPSAGSCFPAFRISTFRRARPVVKVQDGCSQCCAYCIVPASRGAPRSRPPKDVLDEIERLALAGYPEIVVSGINLRQYGQDRPEYGDFWALLAFIDRKMRLGMMQPPRLRISSLDPAQLDGRGIACLSDAGLVCPHIHLSLQHASQPVLLRMGRDHYNTEDIRHALQKLAGKWPVMGLGADLLVGFPGESEEDFEALLDFIRSIPLSYAHVFPFSARPGTPAASMDGQLPKKLRQERAAKLRQVACAAKSAFIASYSRGDLVRIAPDGGMGKNGLASGIDQYYTRCRFPWPCESGPPRSLISARVREVLADGLLVDPVTA